MTQSPLIVHALGSCEIYKLDEGEPVPLTPRRKTRALLLYLLANPKRHMRAQLVDMFCQETAAPTRALALLLSRVRHILPDLLLTEANTIQLNDALIQSDLANFVATLDMELAHQSTAAIAEAIGQYRGEFLEGLSLSNAPEFELWLLGQRAYTRQLYERGLSELISRYSAQHQLTDAIAMVQQLLLSNPLLEEAHGHLMRLYALTGQRQAALAQYERCRALLDEELAVEPSAFLETLRGKIVAGEIEPTLPTYQLEKPILSNGSVVVESELVLPGRDTELSLLNQAWQQLNQQRGSVILVEGEAGSGKSKLVDSFTSQLTANHVLWGSCYKSTTDISLYPWTEILESEIAHLGSDVVAQLSPFVKDVLTLLLPAVALGQSEAVADLPSNRIFATVSEFLTHAKRPLVIVVDDLHWADELSLQFFHHLALRARRLGILLLGIFRNEESEQAPALHQMLSQLKPDLVSRLRLSALSDEAIGALLDVYWMQLDKDTRPGAITSISQATNGNALLVIELIRTLSERNALPDVLPIPPTVRDLTRYRLSQLSSANRQVIEAISVLGLPTTLPEIKACSGRSETEAGFAVEQGLQMGLLTIHDEYVGSTPHYRFKHILLREATLGQINQIRFRRLHRRAAMVLVERESYRTNGARRSVAGRILRHALACQAYDLILAWSPVVAKQTLNAADPAGALNILDQAIDIFDQWQAEPDFDQEQAEKQLRRILYLWLKTNFSFGRSIEEEDVHIQRLTYLVRRYPSPKWEAQALMAEALHYDRVSDLANMEAKAWEAHERFKEIGEYSLAARALITVASARITTSQNHSGREAYKQALDLYRRAGNLAGESNCLQGLAWVEVNLGQFKNAHEYFLQARTTSQLYQDPIGQGIAETGLATIMNAFLEKAKARAYVLSAIEAFRRAGFETLTLRPRLMLGTGYIMDSNWEKMSEVLTETFQDARRLHDSWAEGWAGHYLGRLALAQNDLVQAEYYLEHTRSLRVANNELQNSILDMAWLARLALAKNRVEYALDYTSQVVRQLEEGRKAFYVFQTPDLWLCHAEVLVASGRGQEAYQFINRAYEELMEFAMQVNESQRERWLNFGMNGRILTANKTGQIPPLNFAI